MKRLAARDKRRTGFSETRAYILGMIPSSKS